MFTEPPQAKVKDGVVGRTALLERLGAARVTVLSAPAGSGKTVLLRSWLDAAEVAGRAAWVPTGLDEHDPQRFWLSVADALRRTVPGALLVQALSAAPELDGWAIVERLLTDLAPLRDPLWLVVDDMHELPPEVLRQLELLIMRASAELRFVLAARHDLRLGLHRLRLEGGLAEIRAADLVFTLAEAEELLAAAGVQLSRPALAILHERTEGWAAGLRLAALSLAGHPDPERFAAEFSGTERTVAEYLLAEVLDRQGDRVRRLLLRTSVLEWVNGELAGLLTGDKDAERVLQHLEQANAFVASLDASRTSFRYHQMFADLLRLELRSSAPGEFTALHRTAADWLAAHGRPTEAIRHAHAARDWELAARLLSGHWPSLYLDGQATVVHELLDGFPPGTIRADARLAVVAAADELARGSLEAAELYLGQAERGSASVPQAQRGQLRLLLGVVGLLLARQRGNLPAVAEEARELQAMVEIAEEAQPGLGEDLRALALISLGSTEFWAASFDDARSHLESGVALARQGGRSYLEFAGLAYQAATEIYQSFTRAAERGGQAVRLAERHGWTDDPATGIACGVLGTILAWQGQPEDAAPWVQRAERTLTAETQPVALVAIRHARGVLELARSRYAAALTAFEAAEPLARRLADSPHHLVPRARALRVHSLIRLGRTGHAEQVLAGLSEQDHDHDEIRIAVAGLYLANGDPHAAHAALTPVLDRRAPRLGRIWLVQAYALEAIARERLGDLAAAEAVLERALDLAEPDSMLTPFLLYPAPGLIERHAGHRTTHGALIAEIRSVLGGAEPIPAAGPQPTTEPLSKSELRVLRYLPTNLTAPEIASELSVSRNTVKTQVSSLYAKLGTHRRAEAVERARALGLLAPSRMVQQGGQSAAANPA